MRPDGDSGGVIGCKAILCGGVATGLVVGCRACRPSRRSSLQGSQANDVGWRPPREHKSQLSAAYWRAVIAAKLAQYTVASASRRKPIPIVDYDLLEVALSPS